MEYWRIFKLNDKELCAYTLKGTFAGEKQETIELLAQENNVGINEITTEIMLR